MTLINYMCAVFNNILHSVKLFEFMKRMPWRMTFRLEVFYVDISYEIVIILLKTKTEKACVDYC